MSIEPVRGCYTLAQYPHETVRLACKFCQRKGQYRKDTLLARYGPDIGLPDLRLQISQCNHHHGTQRVCGVYYPDLIREPARNVP